MSRLIWDFYARRGSVPPVRPIDHLWGPQSQEWRLFWTHHATAKMVTALVLLVPSKILREKVCVWQDREHRHTHTHREVSLVNCAKRNIYSFGRDDYSRARSSQMLNPSSTVCCRLFFFKCLVFTSRCGLLNFFIWPFWQFENGWLWKHESGFYLHTWNATSLSQTTRGK